MAYSLQDKYKALLAEGKTEKEAFDILAAENTEFLAQELQDLLDFKD